MFYMCKFLSFTNIANETIGKQQYKLCIVISLEFARS